MSTILEFSDKKNKTYNLTVTTSTRDDLPTDKTWLWKYEGKDSNGHDMVEGMILSASNYAQANERFIAHLLRMTPDYNHSDYAGTKWEARVEGEDYFPDREHPVLMTDFLHA
jgi:hypothetical protein